MNHEDVVAKIMAADINTERIEISMQSIKKIPSEIGRLTKLKTLILKCSYQNQDFSFPNEIMQSDTLYAVAFSDGVFHGLPKHFGQLKKMKALNFEGTCIFLDPEKDLKGFKKVVNLESLNLSNTTNGGNNAFADHLCEFSKLKELRLFSLGLDKIPHNLWSLSNLEILDLRENKIKKMVDGILNLKKLQLLGFPAVLLAELPEWLDGLPNGLKFIKGKYDKKFPALPILRNIFEAVEDQQERNFYLSLLREQLQFENLSSENVIAAVNSGIHYFEKKGIEELTVRLRDGRIKSTPLTTGTIVTFVGKFKRKVSQLKMQLKEEGMKISSKWKEGVTHLVLGTKSGLLHIPKGCNLMTEETIIDFINKEQKPFLLQVTDDQEGHLLKVKELLFNFSDENVLLAIELMRGGGMPKELITDVFLVFKNPKLDKKNKKNLKELLIENGSANLAQVLKKKYQILDLIWDNDLNFYKNVSFFSDNTELDKLYILEYCIKNASHDATKESFNARVLGSLKGEELIKFAANLIDESGKMTLPRGLKKIPEEFSELKSLKSLDMTAFNFKSGKFPKQLFGLAQLEEILIIRRWWSHNLKHMKPGLMLFDKKLLKMSKLKKIHYDHKTIQFEKLPTKEVLAKANLEMLEIDLPWLLHVP